jgi:formamidopyrimidine-DNA glycosylase
MPELPEVETTRRGIEPHAKGKKVSEIIVRNASLRWPVPTDLPQLLQNKHIKGLSRRGKYLLFEFQHGCLIVHLGMSGSLRVVENSDQPGKHDHVDIKLAKRSLRFNDPRRFGCVLWTDEPVETHSLITHLGPEPLLDDFSFNYLYQASRKRSQAVKTFIMDSRIVVGVGNIYANEALFRSGIHPLKAAGKVTKTQYENLVNEIKFVLQAAIERGGTTLRDFVGGDGKPGYFAQELNVYGRGGKACKACGKTLIEKRLGQRTTVYCTRCQK